MTDLRLLAQLIAEEEESDEDGNPKKRDGEEPLEDVEKEEDKDENEENEEDESETLGWQ